MKILITLILILLSKVSFGEICKEPLYDELKQSVSNDIKLYPPQLLTQDFAIQILLDNNTDLSDDTINGIISVSDLPGVEFYLVTFASGNGDASELFLVSQFNCEVVESAGVYDQ